MTSMLDLQRRKLPIIQGAEAADCGLVCLTMISRFHGHDIDLNALRRRFPVSMTGSTLRSLIQIADGLSLSTRAIRVEVEDLPNVASPAILHWDLNHFVVLRSASRQRVVIHDPAKGLRTYSMAEASRHFTGVALEIAPSAGFRTISDHEPVRLSTLWSRVTGFWSAFGQVLILSIALQVISLALPFQLQLVVDEGVMGGDSGLLAAIAVGFAGLMAVQFAIETLRSWSILVFGQTISFQIIGNVVRHLMRLPSDWFEKRHVGDIMSRIGSTNSIQDLLTRGVVSVLIDGLMSVVLLAAMFVYSPALSVVVVCAVLLNLLVSALMFPAMRDQTAENLVRRAREQTHLMETVRAATTIKVMGREPEREGSWRNLFASAVNSSLNVGKLEIVRSSLQALVTNLQLVAIVYLGARTIVAGDGLSIGMLFAFISFQATFSDRANALINQFIQFKYLRVHLDRLSDIVTTDAETAHTPSTKPVRGEIELQDVSFRYGAGDRLVLQNLDLKIGPGEFLAITGASGGGKSTILKLLLGLREPTTGRILLDGEPAAPGAWRSWRSHVGVVAQDDRLLSGSIADNIAFFDPDPDQASIERVARAARVHDDIMRMPMQYLSLVGDMGSALSGGQKQRVLLARALYRQPRVLILDEGTANLDVETEELLAGLIADLPVTRIVVAHRPALLERADRVVRLVDGVLHQVVDVVDQAEPSRPDIIGAVA